MVSQKFEVGFDLFEIDAFAPVNFTLEWLAAFHGCSQFDSENESAI
tara:strand:- start:44967 stop:45104 length:138 start_codon:yes stop_codon:yes gene_type:complete